MQSFAVKIISLRLLKLDDSYSVKRLDSEIAVMSRLNHQHIVRLYETFRTEEHVYLVMELVLGMDLFEMVLAKQGLQEDEAAFIFRQICQAVSYMHERGVIHRDIKPENVILESVRYDAHAGEDQLLLAEATRFNYSVKLIDFGLSKAISDIQTDRDMDSAVELSALGSEARSLVGTPRYCAPEIVSESMRLKMKATGEKVSRKPYTTAVDCFSMGVLLHVMLGSCFPQFNESRVIFQDVRIRSVSEEAKALMRKLLAKNPEDRPTMAQVLRSDPWLNPPKVQIERLNTPTPTRGLKEREGGKEKANFNDTKGKPRGNSKTLTFEEFQEKLFRGIDEVEDLERSDSGESAVSVESIEVGDPVAEKLRAMEEEADVITGLKRQASQEAGKSMNLRPEAKSPNAKLTKEAVKAEDGSKSSIEIDLPGARSGVWGYPVAMEREKEKEDEERKPEMTTELAALRKGQALQQQELEEAVAHAMEDPDRLLGLQADIAASLQAAYSEYGHDATVAPGIVACAVGSRELLRSAENILKKLNETAKSVLHLLPDLQLAVEEGEFGYATASFTTIKAWIQGLKAEAQVS